MLPYPDIDPVLFSVGPLQVRWYSLAYIAGFIIGAMLFKAGDKRFKLLPPGHEEAADRFMVWAVIGVILGGRLGYVLFYNAGYYLEYPAHILRVWEGGMSFHGGLLGAGAAAWFYCRAAKIPFAAFCGLLALAAPAGLFFGRVANFINGELYGRVTDAPLGMVFPGAGDMPRHPSQLYEAVTEGLLLLLILWIFAAIYAKRTREAPAPRPRLGAVLTGIFLLGYGAARAFIEQFREPDAHLGILNTGLTMGQTLSLPLLLLGIGFLIYGLRTGRAQRHDG